MKQWTIYALLCPSTKQVRYVGITSQPLNQRLRAHLLGNDYNPAKDQWIYWLRSQSLLPLIVPIEVTIGTRKQAEQHEKYWIYEFIKFGHDLLNIHHIPNDREHFFTFLRNQAEELSATQPKHQYSTEVYDILKQYIEQVVE